MGVKGARSVRSAASGAHLGGQAIPQCAVADLVVVGAEDDEGRGRKVVGRGAEAPRRNVE